MSIAAFILASASVINLHCQPLTIDNINCKNTEACDRTLEFTLDLPSRSGELKLTAMFEGSYESETYTTDRLRVTPNYIGFPLEFSTVYIDRRNATYTQNRMGGVCELVEDEVDRVF